MIATKEVKQEIFKTHGGTATNTGSAEGQIALFTQRIEHLLSLIHISEPTRPY